MNRKTQAMNPVRRWRTRNGMTQKMFADLCGVSEESVRRWEKGKFMPTENHIWKISKMINVPHDKVLEQFLKFTRAVERAKS